MTLVVVFENGKRREVTRVHPLDLQSVEAVNRRALVWLGSMLESVRAGGLCKSMVLAVHTASADCDHEVSS